MDLQFITSEYTKTKIELIQYNRILKEGLKRSGTMSVSQAADSPANHT